MDSCMLAWQGVAQHKECSNSGVTHADVCVVQAVCAEPLKPDS
jgi:hypothetical protein